MPSALIVGHPSVVILSIVISAVRSYLEVLGGTIMQSKIKSILSSKAMLIINVLFFFSLLIPNRGIIFVAYILWCVYLIYCIRKTSSKITKVILGLFLCFAIFMIVANLYFMLK